MSEQEKSQTSEPDHTWQALACCPMVFGVHLTEYDEATHKPPDIQRCDDDDE